jgi:hypothetical protein
MGPSCASQRALVKMDVNRPIETSDGYQQDGRDLDTNDMLDRLAKQRASGPDAKRAQTLSVVSIVLAGAGGVLIGWPLGEKIGGDPEPTWPLAYAGAGALALTIPVIVWEVTSVSSAVRAHNRALGAE